MISTELLVYCLISSGLFLLAVSGLLFFVERKLRLGETIPESMREESGMGWFVTNFVMEFLFFVAIPSVSFSFLYMILPLTGIRAGMAVALIAFTLGAMPLLMGLTVRIKLPMQFILFTLLGYLIKIGGCLIIIGYLYSL